MSVPHPRVPKVKGKGGERRIGVRTYTLRPSKLEASNEALQIPPPQSHLFPCHMAEGGPERGFITRKREEGLSFKHANFVECRIDPNALCFGTSPQKKSACPIVDNVLVVERTPRNSAAPER